MESDQRKKNNLFSIAQILNILFFLLIMPKGNAASGGG
jgi:hypothetical protein